MAERRRHNLFGIFAVCLTLVFAAAKAFGAGVVATWSWWAVFLPLIAYVGFMLGLLFVLIIAAILVAIFK